jgi:hypothetical protein
MNHRLTISVSASPSSNDHEARLAIDGKDWLGAEFMGLDPPMLENELLTNRDGSVMVGRCSCGAVGCGDLIVEVTRSKDSVSWSRPETGPVTFDAGQYDAEIARFVQDRTWETLGRAVEREVEQVFSGTLTGDDFSFDWASTRIKNGLVHLSFSKGPEQQLFEFGWDEASLQKAIARAEEFREEHFAPRD